MLRLLRAALLAALLVIPLAGCNSLSTTKNKIETVDEAVELLHKIDQDGTWTTLDDALTALHGRRNGYKAEFHWNETPAETSTDPPAAAGQAVAIQVQTDSERNTLFQVEEADAVTTYYSPAPSDSSAVRAVYRVADGSYNCLTGSDPALPLLQDGLASVFNTYAIQATGMKTLSIVEKDGDTTLAGQKATHYTVVSRVSQALDVLTRFDNEALRAQIDAAGAFELSGSLDLDKDSGALLHFDMAYTPANSSSPIMVAFSVTQWGDVPAIPVPAAAEITTACN